LKFKSERKIERKVRVGLCEIEIEKERLVNERCRRLAATVKFKYEQRARSKKFSLIIICWLDD
jgi:hypothetical protein